MTSKKTKSRIIATLVAAVTLGLVAWWAWYSVPGYEFQPGYWVVADAYTNQESNLMVEVSGQVVRLLADDKGNNPQQRFVISLQNQQNIQVIHDLNHAERVPVSINDEVLVRGEYLWTEPGGVIHWTYRDISPKKRHGWIEHEGIRYD